MSKKRMPTKYERAVKLYQKVKKPVVYYLSGDYCNPEKMCIYDGKQVREFIIFHPALLSSYTTERILAILEKIEHNRQAVIDTLKKYKDFEVLDKTTEKHLENLIEEAKYEEALRIL